jgi:hypothetical protein
MNPVYTPGPLDKVAGIVTLSVIVQSASPCVSDYDEMILHISQQSTAYAGIDYTICETGTYVLNTSSSTKATGYTWTTSGTGTFDNAAFLHPEYTPSANDLDDGLVTLTLTAHSAAPCVDAVSTMLLHFSKQATVSAGPDDTICATSTYIIAGATETDATSILWSTSGDGAFSSISVINPVYTPGVIDKLNGIVTLSVVVQSASPCVSRNDAMVLRISKQASNYAGVDATICETGTYVLSTATSTNATSILWTTSGTGSFSNAAAQNPTYTPSQNDLLDGSVTLTMTVTSAYPCVNDVDDMMLNFSRQATVNAGQDDIICETGTYTLSTAVTTDATSITWATNGDGGFSNIHTINPVYTPGLNDIILGSVKLTVTATSASPCVTVDDFMMLSISRQANNNAGPDATICETGTYTLSGATSSHAASFLWTTSGTGTFSNPNQKKPTYTPSQNDIDDGSVTLTMTVTSDPPCVNSVDEMVLTINRQAIVSAGADATICETGVYTLADATQIYGTSLEWTTSGTGSFLDETILNATYLPSALDISNGQVTLRLTAQSATGCVPATDVMVLHISRQSISDAGNNATICETATYVLNTSDETYATSLTWTSSGTGYFDDPTTLHPEYFPSVNDIDDGEVILTLTTHSASPCDDDVNDMILTFSRQAYVSAGPDDIICETGTYTLVNATETNAIALEWNTDGDGTFDDFTALNPEYFPGPLDIVHGWVNLSVIAYSDAPCGIDFDVMKLDISRQAYNNAGSDATICETGTYTLSGASSMYAVSTLWTSSGTGTFSNPNATNPTYTPSVNDIDDGSVILTMTVSSASPCVDDVDQMVLTINRQAIVYAGVDATICETGTYTLTDATQIHATSLTWTSNGTGSFQDPHILNATYLPSSTDIGNGQVTLTLTAQSATACVPAIDEMILHFSRQSIANAGVSDTICETGTYIISTSSQVYASSLTWTTSGTGAFSDPTTLHPEYTPSANDLDDGLVVLTLTTHSALPCIDDADTMLLYFSRQATVTAGVDDTICETSNYQLVTAAQTDATSIAWSTSGDGFFSSTSVINPVYTPGNLDILAGFVTLNVTVQSAVPCVPVSDHMLLRISKQASNYAGVDETICETDNYVLSTATATNYATILWTSSGTGTFSNAAVMNPTYNPSQNDIDDGSVTLTMTVTSAIPCVNDVDQMVLTFSRQAVVNAGADATICETGSYELSGATESDATSIHWTTSGNGSFSNANILNPVYTPSLSDAIAGSVILTVTVQSASPCVPDDDFMVLNISRQAINYAGVDDTICETGTYTLTTATSSFGVSTDWTSSGTGTFSNPNATSPTYTPSQNDIDDGNVILTMTVHSADPCVDAVDQMNLKISRQTIVSAGVDAIICETGTYTLTDATEIYATSMLWTSSGTGTFDFPATLHPTYSPSDLDISNGHVTLKLTAQSASPCVSDEDIMILNISRQATSYAGVDDTICETGTFIPVTAAATYAAGYTWTTSGTGTFSDATTLQPEYTPSPNDLDDGLVTLTLTVHSAEPCVDAIDAMVLKFSRQATVNAGPDFTICETGTAELISAVETNATSILWTTSGSGSFSDTHVLNPVYTPSILDIQAGSVDLTITVQSAVPCVPATDVLTLSISRQAIVSAGINDTICETGTFTVATSTSIYETSLLWTSSGTGSFDDPTLLHPIYFPSVNDIDDGFVTLTVTAQSASPCVIDVDDMLLTFSRQAYVNAGPDATICETETYELIYATEINAASLLWTSTGTGTFSDPTSLNPIYTPTATDISMGSVILRLTAQSADPCIPDYDEMVLNFSLQSHANAGVDDTICETGSYTLITSAELNAVAIVWSSSGTGTFDDPTALHPVYTPSQNDIDDGLVILTMTTKSAQPCVDDVDEMLLRISRQSSTWAGPDAIICETGSYLIANATQIHGTSFHWVSTGDGSFNNANILNPVYTPGANDISLGVVTLTITVQSATPCIPSIDAMDLQISRQSIANAGNDELICETETLTVSTASAMYATGITWSTTGTGSFDNDALYTTTYTPSANDILDGTVMLVLTAHSASPCVDNSDTMVLNFSRQASISAGVDATICETGTYYLADAAETNAIDIEWLSSGSGSFDDPNILHPIYTPSIGDIAAGSVVLTCTVLSASPCIPDIDQMTLNISRQSIAYAGIDATICETGTYDLLDASQAFATSVMWTSSGTGVFTDPTALHPTYLPSQNDIDDGSVMLFITTTSAQPCIDSTDFMVLNFSRQAVITAGPDATICETGTFYLENAHEVNGIAILWTTSGSGSFSDPSVMNPVYNPSPADAALGIVKLTVTVNSAVPCVTVVDSMFLSISRQALASAGIDEIICETESYELITASTTYATSITWTSSGTGTFSNPNAQNPIYTPSPNDLDDQVVILTITATSADPCVNASDEMILQFSRQATVNAGVDDTICETSVYLLAGAVQTDATSIYWTTSGSGTFSDQTIMNPYYSPTAADIATGFVTLTTTVQSAYPCIPVTDEMILHFSQQSLANAGVDDTICETGTFEIVTAWAADYTAIMWTTSGTGTFSDPGIQNPVYIPSVNDLDDGSVMLTITTTSAEPCIDYTDDMFLHFSRQATVNAGPDVTICETGTFENLSAFQTDATSILWTSNGTGSFSDVTSLNPVYTPSVADIATGAVTLTVTVQSAVPCIPAIDSMILNISRQSLAYAGVDDTICETGTYDLTTATTAFATSITWTSSGTGYFSSPNSQNPTYVPSANDLLDGFVLLTITTTSAEPCVNAFDQMRLTFSRQVIVSAGVDATICETGTYQLSTATEIHAVSLAWASSGDGSFDFANTLNPVYTPGPLDIAAGSVVLTITGESAIPCIPHSDNMILSISRQAIAFAGLDDTICETGTYFLTGAATMYATGIDWTSSGTGTFSNPNTQNPEYIPSANDLLDGLVTLTITAHSADPCVDAVDQMTLRFSRQAYVSAGLDATICETGTYELVTSTEINATSLLWTTSGSGTFSDPTALHPVYEPSAGDINLGLVTLTLTAQSASPCIPAVDAMILNISRQAIATAGVDDTICETGTYFLSTASTLHAVAIVWSTSGTGVFSDSTAQNPVYIPSQNDLDDGIVTLTIKAFSAQPCVEVTDEMTLRISKQATVSAGIDDTICETSTFALVTAAQTDAVSLLWSSSGTGSFSSVSALNPVYTPSAADIAAGHVVLTVIAQSAVPCVQVMDDMTLTISLQSHANAGVDFTICEGSTYELNTASAINAASILWTTSGTGTFSDPTAMNPVYTPSPNDLDDASIILTMTTISDAPCVIDVDEMTLLISRQAIVSAGLDATICETETYDLAGATQINATSLLWSTSGTGTFSDPTALNPTYMPSVDDIATGFVFLSLNAHSASPCVDANDTMTLMISRQAIAYAGIDATICQTEAYTLITALTTYANEIVWSTSGTGYFDNPNAQNPTYYPSQNDHDDGIVILTMTSISVAPCVNAVDDMTLLFNGQTYVNAGPDATICETGTYALTGSSEMYSNTLLWTTSGSGYFNDPTALHPVYTPGAAEIAAGWVALAITSQPLYPCIPSTDTMILNISRQAIASAGVDATICETGTYVLSTALTTHASSILWTSSGTGTFNNATDQNPTYIPSANDLLDGSVILTITAYSNAPCVPAVDQMNLHFSKQTIVSAGPDVITCETGNYFVAGASQSFATGLLWTTSGTGIFSDPTAVNPVYDPSNADIAAGSVILTITGQSATPCIPVTDDMLLTFSNQAYPSAGQDATICEGSTYTLSTSFAVNAATILWVTSGTGTFNDPSMLHPTYTPSQNDIDDATLTLTMTVTSENPCINGTDQMTLNISKQAIVGAGADATICETGTYTLAASTAAHATSLQWTTTGTGSFSNAASLHPIYTPSTADIATGFVTLTLTAQSASPCIPASDAMVLHFSRQAIVTAGDDVTICETGIYAVVTSVASYAATLDWSSSGTGTFNDTTALHPVYTPSQNDLDDGSVILTLTATSFAPCVEVTDYMVLTFSKQVAVNAGPDATICATQTFTLAASDATNATSILWTTNGDGSFSNASTLHPVYTPGVNDKATGTVTLTLTGNAISPCIPVNDAMVLHISKQAYASAGVDATICGTGTYTLVTASATYAANLLWTSSGTGIFSNATDLHPTYTPSQNDLDDGVVTLTLTANSVAPCVIAVDQMTLTFSKQATVSAGPDATICQTGTYTLSGSAQANAISMLWTSSGTGIFSNPASLHPVYTPSAADMAAGSVVLTITAQSASPCTAVTDAMVLHISLQAAVNAGIDASVCQGSPYTLITAVATNPASILWTTSGTGTFNDPTIQNPAYFPSQNDIDDGSVNLTISVNSAAPCESVSDMMTLTYTDQAIVDAGTDATICETGTYELVEATTTNATSIVWTTSGDGSFSNTALLNPVYAPGVNDIAAGHVTLTITVQSSGLCVQVVDSMHLNISRQAIVDAGVDATICETGTYTLLTATATYPASLLWTSTGTGTFNDPTDLHPIYTPSQNDIDDGVVILTLSATSGTNCVDVSDEMVLTLSPQASVNAGPDLLICETVTITIFGSSQADAASVLWATSGTGTFNDASLLHPTYMPSAADKIAGSVVLTVTATSTSPCVPVSDFLVLTITRQATSNAGLDATICEGSTYTLASSLATNAAVLVWTTSGTGTFSNASALHPVYTPSPNDLDDGIVTLTLTASSYYPCLDAVDQMVLHINRQSIANAGPDATICTPGSFQVTQATVANAVSKLWTSSGTGSFTNPTAINPVYNPSAADITAGFVTLTITVQSASPCVPSSDAMILHFSKQATANAGADATLCEGTDLVLSTANATNAASILWTTSGTGTFDNASLMNPVYSPSVSDLNDGTVILTLTVTPQAPCQVVSDNMTLTLWKAATAYAGANAALCNGNSYHIPDAAATNFASLLWTKNTGASGVLLNANTIDPTYIPSPGEVGVVTLTLTVTPFGGATCPVVTDQMTITLSNVLTVTAGLNAQICSTDSYTLSGTSNSTAMWTTSGTGTFSPNATTLNAVYTPSIADINDAQVTLTLTTTANGSCQNVSDDMVLTIWKAATAFAGLNADLCNTSTYQILDGSASNYSSYAWTENGTGFLTNTNTLNPTYHPGANENAVVTVTLTVTPQGGTTCPVVTDQMLINVYHITATASTVGNVLCNGGTSGSVTVLAVNGITPYTFLWNNGSTDQTITGLSAGIYTVTVTDQQGCSMSATTSVSQPTAAVGALITASTNPLCESSPTGSATVAGYGGTPGTSPAPQYTYLWSNGATTATINGLAAGTYSVTVTDGNGCTAETSVNLTNPVGMSATIVTSINVSCFGGNNGSATASGTGGSGPYNYLWSNGATTSTISGLSAGLYTVTVTGGGSCTAIATATITQPTVLFAEITGKANVSCFGLSNGSATVNATGGTTPYTFHWSVSAGSQVTATATNLPIGTHTVTVTDAHNCFASISVTILQPTQVTAQAVTTTNNACNGNNNGVVTVNPGGGTPPYNFLWSNGSTNQVVNGLNAGTYFVTVYDFNGCTATSYTMITTIDNVAPVIAAPAAKTVNTNPGACYATNVALGTPNVFDNCGSVTYTNNAPVVYQAGVTVVTWTATDAMGNTATSTQTVTVIDNQAPVIACPADIVHTGVAYITVPLPVTSDNCGVGLVVNDFNGTSNASGIYPAGNTTVTWTVTDIHGNTNTCSMQVTILCELTASNDTVVIPMNTSTSISVISNDSSCGAPITCSDVSVIVLPNHMTVQVNQSTGNITCIPLPGYVGADSLKYRICCTVLAAKGGETDNFEICAEAWAYVNVSPAPTACLVGSTTICPGGSTTILLTLTGVPPFSVVLSNGTTQTTYNGINSTIYPVWVSPASTTTYSIVSVTDATTLSSTSNCTVTVTVEDLTAFIVTGGGDVCPGDPATIVGLSGSTHNVIYELYRDNASTGNQVVGTGGPISFGSQSVVGTYTVIAKKGNCTKPMNGAAVIHIVPAPTQFIVTGGGSCCIGCTDIHVYLSSSQQNVQYQLWLNDVILISTVWGTGSAIDFGYMTQGGTYTVIGSNAQGCTTDMYGSVTATFWPKPVAQLVTNDTTVCDGSPVTLTINLSSGTSPWTVTLFNGTNNTVYTNITASPLVVTVNPLQTTTYNVAVVSDLNGCGNTGLGSTTVTVLTCDAIIGRLSYSNAPQTPLPQVTVNLVDSGTVVQTTTTNSNGDYVFPEVTDGTYQVVPVINLPWGGNNSTDALMIMKHFTAMITLNALQQEAARLNDNGPINSIDAMIVMKRFTQMLNYYPTGDWAYLPPTVVVNGDMHIVDISVLCRGDVNSSFIPSVKADPTVSMQESGVLHVESNMEVMIPVSISQNMKVGAISLVIDYPSDLVQILDVVQSDDARGKMVYNLIGNELRIAWYQTMGTGFSSNENIFYLKARISNPDALSQIRFEAADGCEIADQNGQVAFVELNTPKLVQAYNNVSLGVQPNPFRDHTNFVITTHEEAGIEIWITDLLGHEVWHMENPDKLQAGTHTINVDASMLTQGMYQYRVQIKGSKVSILTGKLIMEK